MSRHGAAASARSVVARGSGPCANKVDYNDFFCKTQRGKQLYLPFSDCCWCGHLRWGDRCPGAMGAAAEGLGMWGSWAPSVLAQGEDVCRVGSLGLPLPFEAYCWEVGIGSVWCQDTGGLDGHLLAHATQGSQRASDAPPWAAGAVILGWSVGCHAADFPLDTVLGADELFSNPPRPLFLPGGVAGLLPVRGGL